MNDERELGGAGPAGGAGVTDFHGLYRAHAQHIHRFVLFLGGDPHLADDIVSETFVRLWHVRSRVDLATVRAYLFTIARNLLLHERRGSARREALDVSTPDPRPGPYQQADARQELDRVLTALGELPEIDRAAVLMRADDGVSYEDIARALGITVSAARVKVHRARLKLAAARARRVRSIPPEETQ